MNKGEGGIGRDGWGKRVVIDYSCSGERVRDCKTVAVGIAELVRRISGTIFFVRLLCIWLVLSD